MGVWDRLRDALTVRRSPVTVTPHAVTRIEYERMPRPEWQAALDAQHVPGTARLVVAWEPGDVWQPIHRWFLWQLQPWHQSQNEAVKQELRGPHPRKNARLVYVPDTVNGKTELRPRMVGGASLVDRRTYELHREVERATGELVIPRRLWVIQGHGGGHPFTLSASEQKLRVEQGLPSDVPSAGDLPYAEFDGRVLAALERYDLFRYAHGLSDPVTLAAKATIRRLHETEVAAHRLLWAKWEGLAEEWADGAAHAARQDGLHYHRWRPVGTKARAVDVDAQRHQFIHDTEWEDAA
jgi:hypothetical protein